MYDWAFTYPQCSFWVFVDLCVWFRYWYTTSWALIFDSLSFSNRIKWRATTLLTFSISDARTVSPVYVNYNKTEQNVHIHWHIANAWKNVYILVVHCRLMDIHGNSLLIFCVWWTTMHANLKWDEYVVLGWLFLSGFWREWLLSNVNKHQV